MPRMRTENVSLPIPKLNVSPSMTRPTTIRAEESIKGFVLSQVQTGSAFSEHPKKKGRIIINGRIRSFIILLPSFFHCLHKCSESIHHRFHSGKRRFVFRFEADRFPPSPLYLQRNILQHLVPFKSRPLQNQLCFFFCLF